MAILVGSDGGSNSCADKAPPVSSGSPSSKPVVFQRLVEDFNPFLRIIASMNTSQDTYALEHATHSFCDDMGGVGRLGRTIGIGGSLGR